MIDETSNPPGQATLECLLPYVRQRLRSRESLCVVCCGDSVSEVGRTPGNFGGASGAQAHWGTLLLDKIARRFETANVQVRFFGVGGQNSYEGLGRLDGLAACNPHLVLLEFGLNDCGYHPLPPAATHLALRTLIEGVRARFDADALLVTSGGDNPRSPRLKNWEATYLILRAVAQECRVPLADVRAVMLSATNDGSDWGAFHNGADDVHPKDAGHRVWAETVYKTLVDELGY